MYRRIEYWWCRSYTIDINIPKMLYSFYNGMAIKYATRKSSHRNQMINADLYSQTLDWLRAKVTSKGSAVINHWRVTLYHTKTMFNVALKTWQTFLDLDTRFLPHQANNPHIAPPIYKIFDWYTTSSLNESSMMERLYKQFYKNILILKRRSFFSVVFVYSHISGRMSYIVILFTWIYRCLHFCVLHHSIFCNKEKEFCTHPI